MFGVIQMESAIDKQQCSNIQNATEVQIRGDSNVQIRGDSNVQIREDSNGEGK